MLVAGGAGGSGGCWFNGIGALLTAIYTRLRSFRNLALVAKSRVGSIGQEVQAV